MHKTLRSEYLMGVNNDGTLNKYGMGLQLPGLGKIQNRDLAKTEVNLWLKDVTGCLLSKW
jgi:hypothetical protein